MLRVGGSSPAFIIVGNKCDLKPKRKVSEEEGVELARRLRCPFFETSALTAHNVDEAFFALVRLLRRAQQTPEITEEASISAATARKRGKGCITM